MSFLLADLAGIDRHPVSHTERFVSIAGACLSIASVFMVSRAFLPGAHVPLLIASMGASAVLLFAVPHGTLSQPWPLVGGHIISALIGVTCALFIPNVILAGAIAVGLAVGAMHYLRCIHPPGGATALTAAIGGSGVHVLGYGFVVTPVLLNVSIMLIIAVAFNWCFPWRRYPAILSRKRGKSATPEAPYEAIAHADFVYALSQIDSFIDVNEEDLMRIYQLATNRHAMSGALPLSAIRLGHFYSNGEYGPDWAVRQIVDEGSGDKVIYKTIVGPDRRSSGVMTRLEFSRWAKHEVVRDDENWRRVETHETPSTN